MTVTTFSPNQLSPELIDLSFRHLEAFGCTRYSIGTFDGSLTDVRAFVPSKDGRAPDATLYYGEDNDLAVVVEARPITKETDPRAGRLEADFATPVVWNAMRLWFNEVRNQFLDDREFRAAILKGDGEK